MILVYRKLDGEFFLLVLEQLGMPLDGLNHSQRMATLIQFLDLCFQEIQCVVALACL
jgi:hypothetical protein